MKKTVFASVLGILLLSGCIIFPKPDTTIATYNFIAGSSAETIQSDQQVIKSGKKILVNPVFAPLWLDTKAIRYRLDYQNASQTYIYAHSRWSAPPAILLTQQIKQKIAAETNLLVIQDSSMTIAENELHLELEEFSHIFDTITDSHIVIRFRASLVNNTHRFIAQKIFTAQQTAQTADAAGAVNAFSIASNQLVDELIYWLNEELNNH